MTPPRSRRRILATLGAAAVGSITGCTGRDDPQVVDSTGDGDGGGDTRVADGADGDGSGDGDAGTDDGSTTGDGTDEDSSSVVVRRLVKGLSRPWGMAVRPDGRLLVTEIGGQLRQVDLAAGSVESVDGLPEVYVAGQGGLLDVALHPDFPDRPWVYLTYSLAGRGGSTTALGRGRLVDGRLRAFERLHAARPYVDDDRHYGSRVVFGPDGLAYVTVGDRHFKDFGPDHVAQDRTNDLGSVLRLAPDGAVPADNPFVDGPGSDRVFSYGHRNPQGLAVHPETGDVWESEHGEKDGDEINVLRRGDNYGWPVADEGCPYGGDEPIGVSHDDRSDVVAPAYTWPCGSGGYPPGGATFYDGDAVPEWQGDLFVANLAAGYLGRFRVEGTEARPTGRLLADRDDRVRDVTVGPDGGLLVAIDAGSAPILRIGPE